MILKPRQTIVFLMLALLSPCAWAAQSTDDVWTLLRQFRFDEARAVAAQAPITDRSARLALATALMNVQPSTDRNLSDAAEILEQLRSGSTKDVWALRATYLLARLRQFHPRTADLAAAQSLYDECIRMMPNHPLAQVAVVKLAILKLYAQQTHDERLAVFNQYAERAESLSDRAAKRDLHLVLASVAAQFELGQQRSLEQLLKIDVQAIVNMKTLGDVFVRRSELARQAGLIDAWNAAARAFLDGFPGDPRGFYVRQQLQTASEATHK
jgi:hypothetical protein